MQSVHTISRPFKELLCALAGGGLSTPKELKLTSGILRCPYSSDEATSFSVTKPAHQVRITT